MDVLILITIVLSIALVVLVSIQPRQTQIYSNDSTSNIEKPSYWQSDSILKILTLVVSIALFILLFVFMMFTFR